MAENKNLISIKQIRESEFSTAVTHYTSGALNATGQLLQSEVSAIQAVSGQLLNFAKTVNTTGNQEVLGVKTFYDAPRFPSPPVLGDNDVGALVFGSGSYKTVLRGQPVSGIEVLLPVTGGVLITEVGAGTLISGLLGSANGVGPYNIGSAVTGNIAVNYANGKLQKANLTSSTIARVIQLSTGSVLEGSTITLRVSSDSVGYTRTLNFDSNVAVPSDFLIFLPKAIPAGKTYMMRMYFNGTKWDLVSFLGAF